MRNIAALIIGALALTCSNSVVTAQNSGTDLNGQSQEAVTFVLELDDDMIETLKNGEDLKSLIPVHLRNKVTEVHLRYNRNQTADRSHGAGLTTPRQPISSSDPFRSSESQNGLGQRGDTRFDSNRRDNSADSLINQRPPQNNNGIAPRPSTTPKFQPSGTYGGQSNNTNDRLVPAASRNPSDRYDQGTQIDRERQPVPVYGPPAPNYSNRSMQGSTQGQSTRNPYANRSTESRTPERSQPTVNPGGFQPRQPASTQGQRSDSYRQQPTDTRVQPRTPSGSEFDTVQNNRRNRNPSSDYANQPAWDFSPQQQTTRSNNTNNQNTDRSYGQRSNDYRSNNDGHYAEDQRNQNRLNNDFRDTGYANPPRDRLASNQWNNGTRYGGQGNYRESNPATNDPGWQPPRQTYQPSPQSRSSLVAGHDTPMIRNQVPRIASRPGYEDTYNANGSLPAASIPGDQNRPHADGELNVNDGPNGIHSKSPVSQLNQFNNFLYFLLLCSIGLNIYLAWISRGFYVRYRELADELRDTFSTV